jgi:hypothetical protein
LLFDFKVDKFDVGSRYQGDFVLQHNLWDEKLGVKWNVLNVYVAAQDELKDNFLVELVACCSKNKEPYIWGVQYCEVLFKEQKNSP